MTSVSAGMGDRNISSMASKQAEQWFVRLMAPDCTAAERKEYRRWIDADAANARAYALTERLWSQLEGMEGDKQIGAWAAEALEPEPRRANFIPLAVAASFVLAAVALYAGYSSSGIKQTTVGTGTYITDDHTRQLALEDGSVVKLDIDTQLKVTLSKGSRVLELAAGRAMFDVAVDRKRPFTVRAGDSQVVALGTRFQVDRTAERIKVVLTEGAVKVTQALTEGKAAKEVTLAPGEELIVATQARQWSKRAVDPEPLTSWALDYHVFRDTPLGEAVDEINRYAAHKIHLTNPELAKLPVSGSFKSGDSDSIATALPSVLPVRVERRANEIQLSPR